MLPVTHGVDFTRRRIIAYTMALLPVSLMPCITGLSGALYGVGLHHIQRAWTLMRRGSDSAALVLFRYSITYSLRALRAASGRPQAPSADGAWLEQILSSDDLTKGSVVEYTQKPESGSNAQPICRSSGLAAWTTELG